MNSLQEEERLVARIRSTVAADDDRDWQEVVARARPRTRPTWAAVTWWPRRRLAPALALAAVLAAAVGLAPRLGGDDGDPLLQGALAALGRGPVLHARLTTPLASQTTGPRPQPVSFERVELATGRSRPVESTIELWWDERRGVLHAVFGVGGAATYDALERQGDPVGGSVDPALTGVIKGYRAALVDGTAARVGAGRVAGREVVWLRFPPPVEGGEAGEVAVDAGSYEAIAVRFGPAEYGVAALELVERRPADFRTGRAAEPPPAAVEATDRQASVGDAGAWLGGRLPILPGEPRSTRLVETAARRDSTLVRGRGVIVDYGGITLAAADTPIPFESFTFSGDRGEARTRSGAPVPTAGFAELSTTGDKRWTGQLRRDGLLIEITGRSRAEVFEAIRSLELGGDT